MGNIPCCSSCAMSKDDIETRRFVPCSAPPHNTLMYCPPTPHFSRLPPPLDMCEGDDPVHSYLKEYANRSLEASKRAFKLDQELEKDAINNVPSDIL